MEAANETSAEAVNETVVEAVVEAAAVAVIETRMQSIEAECPSRRGRGTRRRRRKSRLTRGGTAQWNVQTHRMSQWG